MNRTECTGKDALLCPVTYQERSVPYRPHLDDMDGPPRMREAVEPARWFFFFFFFSEKIIIFLMACCSFNKLLMTRPRNYYGCITLHNSECSINI